MSPGAGLRNCDGAAGDIAITYATGRRSQADCITAIVTPWDHWRVLTSRGCGDRTRYPCGLIMKETTPMPPDPAVVSRRQFIRGLGAGVILGGGGFGAFYALTRSDSLISPGAASMPSTIDPNAIRRRGVGFRGYDAQRVFQGATLFAPMTGDGAVYLIDIQGKVIHTWKLPYPPGLYGYLTDRGTLFYNGQIRNDSFIGGTPFMGGAAMEVDWSGKVLWEIKQPDHHHDGRLLRNGNVLLLCSAELPAAIAKRVKGGLPGSEQKGGKMNSDYLLERTTDGKTVWEWRAWEHMEPDEYAITSPSDNRQEWTHGNGLAELPDGNILLSFRNISTLVRINRTSVEML